MVPWVGAWYLGSTVAAAGWNSSGQVYWGHLRPPAEGFTSADEGC